MKVCAGVTCFPARTEVMTNENKAIGPAINVKHSSSDKGIFFLRMIPISFLKSKF